MNKWRILSFMWVLGGMIAHLTACVQDEEIGAIPTLAINSNVPAGDVAPMAPVLLPEPVALPVSFAPPFQLDEEGFDGYYGSQGSVKDARTANDDECGNGVLDPHEECDDGNVDNGTVCKDCEIIREGCSLHVGAGSTYIYCTGNDLQDGETACINIPCSGFETWSNAQETCKKFGPFNLATISSSIENTFITSFINASAWIGLNDIDNENTFVWVSGIPVTFTNWNSGEPNNDGNQDCTHIFPPSGKWDDLGCSSLLGFVCEVDGNDDVLAVPLETEPPVDVPSEAPVDEEALEPEGEPIEIPPSEHSGDTPTEEVASGQEGEPAGEIPSEHLIDEPAPEVEHREPVEHEPSLVEPETQPLKISSL